MTTLDIVTLALAGAGSALAVYNLGKVLLLARETRKMAKRYACLKATLYAQIITAYRVSHNGGTSDKNREGAAAVYRILWAIVEDSGHVEDYARTTDELEARDE